MKKKKSTKKNLKKNIDLNFKPIPKKLMYYSTIFKSF